MSVKLLITALMLSLVASPATAVKYGEILFTADDGSHGVMSFLPENVARAEMSDSANAEREMLTTMAEEYYGFKVTLVALVVQNLNGKGSTSAIIFDNTAKYGVIHRGHKICAFGLFHRIVAYPGQPPDYSYLIFPQVKIGRDDTFYYQRIPAKTGSASVSLPH